MDKAFKDLIRAIDQLVTTQRNYPWIKLPNFEKKRLEKVVQKILHNHEISEKEWEELKPKNPEPKGQIEQRKKELNNDRVKASIKRSNDLNRNIINETEALKNQAKKMATENRISMGAYLGKLPANSFFTYCKKCEKRFTEGEYSKHVKICGKKTKS